jgi:restriction system protein
MFGLMTAEHADETIIVTSGKFTRDAQDFAAGKPIRLIDGSQLLALVQSVQTVPPASTGDPDIEQNQTSAPTCPLCGKPMVQRTARRGSNSGNQFWGCPGYPACKGTRSGSA